MYEDGYEFVVSKNGVWLTKMVPVEYIDFPEFKEWLLESDREEISIADLIMTKEEISDAVSNLSRGLSSVATGPLTVNYHESIGRFELTNGYHRVVEALMSGKKVVPIKNDGAATWEVPKSELFVPDFSSEFFGMEDFIEYYELKRLR